MKFVDQHLTTHHLFHAPHKWFFAFLLSPIHAAELHYQNHYHLRFSHARKLFLFDMFLIACVFLSAGLWMFISLYDPTVTKNIVFNLSASEEKIRNGETLTYTIFYHNKSKENLIDAKISMDLPKGFVLEQTQPQEIFLQETKTFVLPVVAPGANGQVSVRGRFFGNAEEKILTASHFSYKQQSRMRIEEKLATIATSPRGSVLSLTLKTPNEILNQSIIPGQLSLTNTGDKPIESLSVILDFPGSGKITSNPPDQIQGKTWNVPQPLAPGQNTNLEFSFETQGLSQENVVQISATPKILVQGQTFIFAQPAIQSAKVFTPEVDFVITHDSVGAFIAPGKILNTTLHIKNPGNIALKNIDISLPLENEIDRTQIAILNHGTLKGNTFHINAKYHAGLTEIAPGASVPITLKIPVRTILTGADLILTVQPTLSAELKNIPGIFTKTAVPLGVKIGTHLGINSSIRYYTAEGDQLGRGPIPPRVGKETKYGAIIYITNSTSKVENINFSAELPSFVIWQDKASASKGKEPLFDPTTREVRWNTSEMNPGQTISLFIQLGFTPTPIQVGTTPLLLKNISITGTDMFINQTVSNLSPNLDTSLPNDALARIKGVKVLE